MIKLHHLNNSRSQRILWMLEELELEYEVVKYDRDKVTILAPESLKKIHPLGKAPVLEDGDLRIAESGAIIHYLAERYGNGALLPTDGQAKLDYHYWLHFAEGSLMPPMLMKLVFDKVQANAKPFFVKAIAKGIAKKVMTSFIGPNMARNMAFINAHLGQHPWFAGELISGADVQMSFPLEAAVARGLADNFPHIKAYVARIHARPAYQRGLDRGGEYDYA